jgi:hypothetical protein
MGPLFRDAFGKIRHKVRRGARPAAPAPAAPQRTPLTQGAAPSPPHPSRCLQVEDNFMDVAPAFIFFGVMVRVPLSPWRPLGGPPPLSLRPSPPFPPQVYGVKGLRAKLLRDHRD